LKTDGTDEWDNIVTNSNPVITVTSPQFCSGLAITLQEGNLVGYVTVYDGRIWKFTKSGTTVSASELSNSGIEKWRGITTIDANIIYASIEDGDIWKSSDGGVSWSKLQNSFSSNWRGLDTIDGISLYSTIYTGNVYRFTDGGKRLKTLFSVSKPT
jgi:photosystem II stability/assembly factor-like uncharacterized protein